MKNPVINSNDYGQLNINVEQSTTLNNNPQLLSYYPKYDYLDSLISQNPKDTINIFVDVKGCCTGIYQEWCVRHIIESSKKEKHLNLDLFSSVMMFIAFHKRYAIKRNIKINFIFFMEQGKSKYHLNIYKDYKSNRHNSDFFGLDIQSREEFFNILDKNYTLCEYVINRIPDCSFYCLKYCEADFIPYYLLKYMIPQDVIHDSLNIIYSRDKDMLQCLQFENTYQFYRSYLSDKSEFITEKTLFTHFNKTESIPIDSSAKWFPLVLSLCGDSGDGVPGIKGLGPKVIYKNIDTIMKAYSHNPDKMYERVMNGDNVLNESWEYQSTQTLSKIFGNPDIVKRNMQLISYQALCDWVNGGFPTEAIDVKNYIERIYNSDVKLSSYKILWQNLCLKKLDDILDEKTVQETFL